MVCGAELFLISINADFIFHMISLHTHTHKNNKQKENKEGFIFNMNYRLKLSKKVIRRSGPKFWTGEMAFKALGVVFLDHQTSSEIPVSPAPTPNAQ